LRAARARSADVHRRYGRCFQLANEHNIILSHYCAFLSQLARPWQDYFDEKPAAAAH